MISCKRNVIQRHQNSIQNKNLKDNFKAMLQRPDDLRYKIMCGLTGTAAMRVGFNMLASPLLPFLILVDWGNIAEERLSLGRSYRAICDRVRLVSALTWSASV